MKAPKIPKHMRKAPQKGLPFALPPIPQVAFPDTSDPPAKRKRGRPPKQAPGVLPTASGQLLPRKRKHADSVAPVAQPAALSDYRDVYADHALRVLMLGHTRKELAQYFGVSESDIARWERDYDAFAKTLRVGIANASVPVVHALHKRATGFVQETPGEYILDNEGRPRLDPDGKPMRRLIVQYFPPDTAAIQTWLKAHYKPVWGQEVKAEVVGSVALTATHEARKNLLEIFNAPPDKPPERA